MLADNGGTRPKGLKGAFDKAKDAWMKEHGRPRSKSPRPLKPLMDEDHNDSDDDESDLQPLGSMLCTNIFGLRCLPCEPNKEVVIENDEDIEQILKVFALPEGERAKQCAMPDSHGLKKGEKWCMMDSGAGCHAADAKKEFPHHRRRKGKHIRKCVLANGAPMESDEVVDVKASVQGQTHEIEFDDLPVECPIISVRKIIRKGNKAVFEERGAYILNKANRKHLIVTEKHGVYFIKIMLHPSDEDVHRLGR